MVIINSWLANRTPALQSSDFVNHSYDYRPNWTPLSPITIINKSRHCVAVRVLLAQEKLYEIRMGNAIIRN